MEKSKPADFSVDHDYRGPVAMVYPKTPAAKKWAAKNIAPEDWQCFSGGFAVEPSYVDDLIAEMEADGLGVE